MVHEVPDDEQVAPPGLAVTLNELTVEPPFEPGVQDTVTCGARVCRATSYA